MDKWKCVVLIMVITFEQYASERGYSFMGHAEPALHRRPGQSQKQISKDAKIQYRKAIEYDSKREELREEYNKKIASGKIREPNRVEKLINIAGGHPDNESVRAARRLLDKKGINVKNKEVLKNE